MSTRWRFLDRYQYRSDHIEGTRARVRAACRWVLMMWGWVLIVPPLDDAGVLLTRAPLDLWVQMKAFDSAKECEAGRPEEIEHARRLKGFSMMGGMSNYQLSYAKCLPVELVYPRPGKPK